jgi:hypothetical protein
MPSHQSESGICIVRVEVQPGHLLITVTTNRNLDRNLRPATSDSGRRFTDPGDALQAVADFLRSFADAPLGLAKAHCPADADESQ